MEDTVVLVTACMDSWANDRDFLPLTVDYREYTYSEAEKFRAAFSSAKGAPQSAKF